jgi:hypothetical protein
VVDDKHLTICHPEPWLSSDSEAGRIQDLILIAGKLKQETAYHQSE